MTKRMILNETAYFGKGAIGHLPEEIKGRGFKKGLIVTDKGLMETGIVSKIEQLLKGSQLDYAIFDEAIPNPTVSVVQNGVERFASEDADYLIAVGGGSPIDTAKAIGIISNNTEFSDVVSLEGIAETANKSVPILAIPTTSGTAAEVTINYVITDENKKRKFVCVDPHDIPLVAFIDSDMMLGMPRALAAATGMDALTHAIEGFITKDAWEMTDMLHLKAIELIYSSLKQSVEGDEEARETMALGQYLAGMGFSNVGLGLVHGMAHPLGAWYDTPHGVANAILLPTVMSYNQEFTGEKYREIARAIKLPDFEQKNIEEVRNQVVAAIQQLSVDVGIPSSLTEIGFKKEDVASIAADALNDVCTGGNPRPTSVEDIIALYQQLI